MAFQGTIGVCDVLYSVLSALGPQYTTTTDHRHQAFSPQQARSRSFWSRLPETITGGSPSVWSSSMAVHATMQAANKAAAAAAS
jgi:hypothetical protein